MEYATVKIMPTNWNYCPPAMTTTNRYVEVGTDDVMLTCTLYGVDGATLAVQWTTEQPDGTVYFKTGDGKDKT